MISEATQISRHFERIEQEAEEVEQTESDRVWARMQRGKDCWPYAAVNIAEAINEADIVQMHELQRAMEDDDWLEVGYLVRGITRDYWERQAKAPRVAGVRK